MIDFQPTATRTPKEKKKTLPSMETEVQSDLDQEKK